MANKYLIGFLVLVFLTSSIYLMLPENVKLEVQGAKTIFSVWEDNKFVISGTEYNSIYQGSKKISPIASKDKIYNLTEVNKVKLIREREYTNNEKIIDTYEFDSSISDKELFPISHKIEIFNAKDKFFRYEAKNLIQNNPLGDFTQNPVSFGRNMKLSYQEKNKRWAKLYTSSLAIQYSIPSNYEVYYIRFFDPVITQITPTGNITTSNSSVELNFNISAPEGIVLNNTIWNWDGVNYTLWNGLVGYWQFNNFSSLGENSTHVYDVSGNNNGTLIGTNIIWTPNGKYSGTWSFDGINSSINGDYIDTGTPINTSILPWSVGLWIKPYATNHTDTNEIWTSEWNRMSYSDSGVFATSINNLSNSNFEISATGTINQWNYVTWVVTENLSTLYLNGVYKSNKTFYGVPDDAKGRGTTIKIGSRSGYAGALQMNGSIDDLMIFNRSLSSSEIQQLYYSSLTKYDSQNWTLNINQSMNQSLLNSTTTSLTYNYYACSSNSSGSENCSSQKTITQTISNKVLTANFTSSIGNVRSDFYGVNIQNPTRLVGSYTIDINCDGVGETTGNYTWSQESYLNGRYGTSRYDISLVSYYDGLYNLDIETFKNDSTIFINGSQFTSISKGHGWGCSRSGTSTGFCSRSTDVHSGSYSFNISANASGSELFTWYNGVMSGLDTNDIPNGFYNFSVWIKVISGSVSFKVINATTGGYTTLCQVSSITSNSWTQYSCIYNKTGYVGTEITVSVGALETAGEEALIDDLQITKDGELFNWWRIGNDTAYKNAVQYNYDNDKRMLLILDYMPTFLANWSDPNCEGYSGSSSGDGTCMPYDWNIWKNISYDSIDRFTNNNTTLQSILDIEVWNEPYGNLGNYTYDSIPLALAYVQLFNNSYNAIKGLNSNIPVGGPSGFQMTTTPNISKTFFSNQSNRFDFISFHPYSSDYKGTNNMYNYLYNIQANCTALGGGSGCNRIINSEWETYNNKNVSSGQSNDFKSEIAMAYQSVLNWNPSNVSMHYYHWFDTVSYFNCPSRYSEYPAFWSSVSEKGLDNESYPTYYPPYNVTKNFANYCPAGSTVYSSSSDDSTIKTVTCKKENSYNLIAINTDTVSKNVTINLTGNYSYSSITNSLGQIYNLNSNAELGIMDSYDILYLGSPELNVSLGNNISNVEFRPMRANSQDVWAVNQTNSKGVFNISNTGLGTAQTIGIKLNQTQSGWGIECNNQTTGNWINLTTSYQTIYSNLLGENSFQVWCRADLNYPANQFNGRIYFNITS